MDDLKFFTAIHNRDLWQDSFEEPLRIHKLLEPKKSWSSLIIISGQLKFQRLYPNFFKSLLKLIGASYHPDLALNNFERFTQTIIDKNYLYTILSTTPETLKSLIVLFSGSQNLTDSLLSDPSYFNWINNSDIINNSRSKDEFMRAYYDLVKKHNADVTTPYLLRKFKKREYIRIGLRDLLGKTNFKETGEDLSHLADLSLQIAYEYADKKMKEKYGIPFYRDNSGELKEVEFAILGMGKL
ncbi:MAG: hypothetical protein HON82_09890, partial [Candidatus Marinimicrobia bacterium]|nr:hypothetical protein [Candidatus Neomarinimicrobiota bacterium]